MTGWRLVWGYHDGTMLGRDTGDPVENLGSLEECREKAEQLKQEYSAPGKYRLWFATAVGPNGIQVPFSDLAERYVG